MRRPGLIVFWVLVGALNGCSSGGGGTAGNSGGTAGTASGGRGGSGRGGGTGGGPGGSVGGGGGAAGGTTGGAVGASGGVGGAGVVGGAGGTSGSTGVGGVAGGATDGGAGAGGADGLYPADLISDFEDVAAATVVMAGTPPRNGYWYAFNDDNPAGVDSTCVQVPKAGPQTAPNLPPERYFSVEPPGGVHAGSTGSRALRGRWTGCVIWGAGIGADLLIPVVPDGGIYMGPRIPYDVTPYKGVTFWARAAVGSDTALRIKFPMRDETKVEDGGDCIESATNKCGDSFGTKFNMPSDGSWKQFTVRWTDATFVQEGWGKPFTWRPVAVTSIQIVSVDRVETYDFYVDDISFIR